MVVTHNAEEDPPMRTKQMLFQTETDRREREEFLEFMLFTSGAAHKQVNMPLRVLSKERRRLGAARRGAREEVLVHEDGRVARAPKRLGQRVEEVEAHERGLEVVQRPRAAEARDVDVVDGDGRRRTPSVSARDVDAHARRGLPRDAQHVRGNSSSHQWQPPRRRRPFRDAQMVVVYRSGRRFVARDGVGDGDDGVDDGGVARQGDKGLCHLHTKVLWYQPVTSG